MGFDVEETSEALVLLKKVEAQTSMTNAMTQIKADLRLVARVANGEDILTRTGNDLKVLSLPYLLP